MAETTNEIVAEGIAASGGASIIGGALKLLAAGALVALGGDLYRSSKSFVQDRRNMSEAIGNAKKDGELEAYRNMASGGKKKHR